MIHATDCVLVMGRRGCGKSFLAKRLQSLWPRRIIVDALGEYTAKDGELVHSFEEYADALERLDREKPASFVLIFQFDPESELSEDEFGEVCRLAYYFGNLQLVIEEVQLYATPHRMPHWLKQCLLTGRHRGLSLMFTTQRPGELHKTILSQCAHIFCGTIFEGNDLRYVSSFLNQDAERLSKLPIRRFIYFSNGHVQEVGNDEI